ncbi:MAG: universal stress protein [Chitinophagales bacterium]
MKKILFLCDGDNYPHGAFQFLKMMNAQEPIFLKGIFFNAIDYEQLITLSYLPLTAPYERMKTAEIQDVERSKEEFKKDCLHAGIKFLIHEKNEEWNRELLVKESRYSDCMVISEDLFMSQLLDTQPNFFMQELLHGSECPVAIIPEKFHEPDRLVFAFDGKKESIHALKQFTYLFPKYMDLPAQYVYVSEDEEEFPDEELLKEFSRCHNNAAGFAKLTFDPKKYFATWLEYRKNAILVTGSYSRSSISNLMRSSFTDHVIREHACPIFVAHV